MRNWYKKGKYILVRYVKFHMLIGCSKVNVLQWRLQMEWRKEISHISEEIKGIISREVIVFLCNITDKKFREK